MELPEKVIKLRSLNPHIVCMLCAGYFVEATTIIECLHTFCKSCIVRYLQSSKYCPTCGTLVHETEPLSNIKADRTMQDIMDKILPNIRAEEERREEEFFKKIRNEESENSLNNAQSPKQQIDLSNFPSGMKHNEHFNICLELDRTGEMCFDEMEVTEIVNKYVRCSGRVKIMHLKKLIRKFYTPHCSNFGLKMKCNNEELEDMEHVKLVYVVYWKCKSQPIVFYYKFVRLSEGMTSFSENRISKVSSNAEMNATSADDKTSQNESLDNAVDENQGNSSIPDKSDLSYSLVTRSCDLHSTIDSSLEHCVKATDVPYVDENKLCSKMDNGKESFKSCISMIRDESLSYNSHHTCLTVT